MGGSIHINKTGSSIIDTIFVCRVTGTIPRRWIVVTPGEIAQLVREDIEHLCAGEVCPTQGDMRCIIFGHMVRLAVWQLRHTWNQSLSVEEKLAMVAKQLQKNRGFQAIEQCLGNDLLQAPRLQHAIAREHEALYGTRDDDISF
jgi:hypothetical protein